ncbi:DOMON-like domain-containing protein [Sphingomonas sp. LT1P40]|uniref:DOMON-like domain-containing protein n=1 Tax=Alteristakelama amylovorans TaxID=3096166 RepID=UPI002FC6BF10
MQFDLIPHSDAPPVAVGRVHVTFAPDRLRFEVAGAAALRLPTIAVPERTDELWRTTCFELFIKPDGGDAYVEFNFSPSTRWAAYAFDGYRAGMRDMAVTAAPAIARDGDSWTVALSLSDLPEGDWRVALNAVIEEADGSKSYWALAHPDGGPDFHHDACFALSIPAPRVA